MEPPDERCISAWRFAGGVLSATYSWSMAGRECLYLFMEDQLQAGSGGGGANRLLEQQQAGNSNSNSNSKAAGDVENETDMDGRVWSRLPEDVLYLVLIRLPILSLRRFLCVSRRWRAVISDPTFARECDSKAAPMACLCCFGVEAGESLLQLPQHSCLRPRRIEAASLPGSGSFALDLWASDKGLLCFSKRKQGYGETYLFICNPVTRMWRPLPALRFEEFEVLHRAFLQVEDRTREYEVVLLAKTLAGSCRLFVFSSSSSGSSSASTSTSAGSDAASGLSLGWRRMDWDMAPPSPNREPVLCNGIIHAWRSSPGAEKVHDSSFCFRSGREVDVPQLPFAYYRKLVEVDGALFLAAFLEPFAGISVWKMDAGKLAWELDSGCPAKEYMNLTGSRTAPLVARLKVGAVAGFICLCTEKSLLRPALAYDTRGKTWCAWDFGVADPRSRKKMFPFQPRFA